MRRRKRKRFSTINCLGMTLVKEARVLFLLENKKLIIARKTRSSLL
jgi:hypothetical protein